MLKEYKQKGPQPVTAEAPLVETVILVCCLIDFQLNNAECFFIDKATERGDAVASLSEVNAVRWENRQVI